jgi:hypothetical protein
MPVSVLPVIFFDSGPDEYSNDSKCRNREQELPVNVVSAFAKETNKGFGDYNEVPMSFIGRFA